LDEDGLTFGIVGCAGGGLLYRSGDGGVLSSGCRLLINVTSSGQITPVATPPCFILIDRALWDEGTRYHYLSPDTYSIAPMRLLNGWPVSSTTMSGR
jgi:hypothetical protein